MQEIKQVILRLVWNVTMFVYQCHVSHFNSCSCDQNFHGTKNKSIEII